MLHCVDTVKPDHIIHLGDYYEDAETLANLYSHLQVHCVPGNGDFFGSARSAPRTMCYEIDGVRIYMTHGHLQGVKGGLDRLLADAKEKNAQIVTFGHTHEALCFKTNEHMWVLNPGSCRSWSGSAGVIEVADKRVSACYIVKQADLEAMQGQE